MPTLSTAIHCFQASGEWNRWIPRAPPRESPGLAKGWIQEIWAMKLEFEFVSVVFLVVFASAEPCITECSCFVSYKKTVLIKYVFSCVTTGLFSKSAGRLCLSYLISINKFIGGQKPPTWGGRTTSRITPDQRISWKRPVPYVNRLFVFGWNQN